MLHQDSHGRLLLAQEHADRLAEEAEVVDQLGRLILEQLFVTRRFRGDE